MFSMLKLSKTTSLQNCSISDCITACIHLFILFVHICILFLNYDVISSRKYVGYQLIKVLYDMDSVQGHILFISPTPSRVGRRVRISLKCVGGNMMIDVRKNRQQGEEEKRQKKHNNKREKRGKYKDVKVLWKNV